MDAGKRSHQEYVEDQVEEDEEDSDSDVPLRQTQAKRLKRSQQLNPARAISPPPLQPLRPAPIDQAQPATQPTITTIRPERTQCRVQRPRPRVPAPSIRTQLSATAVINSARQASRSFDAVSETSPSTSTATENPLPIDGIDSNPPQPRWPPLPDNNNIPHAYLCYAEEIRTVVNILCGKTLDSGQFFEILRHETTAPLIRPSWTVPDLEKQEDIGFLCGKFPAHHHRNN
ncbi:hypothetical protein F52700_7348 [Fusarium sp. NRRL 52700]|nr:hypothetical protein F52700_7348 [Fusarium sp. NRRL 52700]